MRALVKGIYSRLSGDATLTGFAPGGVWHGVAPSTASGVVVVYSLVSAADDYTLGRRATVTERFQIKAVAPGPSAAPAWSAAERVEALLTDQAFMLDGASLMMCRREQVISFTEQDGGEQYQHAGGIYQFMVQ